jgi:hypothetical protein
VAILTTDTVLLAMDKRFIEKLATVCHVEIFDGELSGSHCTVSHLKANWTACWKILLEVGKMGKRVLSISKSSCFFSYCATNSWMVFEVELLLEDALGLRASRSLASIDGETARDGVLYNPPRNR